MNRGDAALVEELIWLIRRSDADAEISIGSFTPQLDSSFYGVRAIDMMVRPSSWLQRQSLRVSGRITVWAWLQSILHLCGFGLLWIFLGIWSRIRIRHPRLARLLCWRGLWENAEEVLSADSVISAPGGFLNAYRWTDTLWLYHTPIIALARGLGKPVVLSNCSVGPFAGPSKLAARVVLSAVDRIVLRESISKSLVAGLRGSSTSVTSYDLAFLRALRMKSRGVADLSGSGYVLGISVRPHNFPGHPRCRLQALREEFLRDVVEAVGRVVESDPSVRIRVVAQTAEDVRYSAMLISMLSSKFNNSVEFVDTVGSTDELVRAYAACRVVLATRMHAGILAMCAGVPVVAVGYEPKTLGVFDSVGLANRVISIEESRLIPDLLEAVWTAAEIERDRVAVAVAVGVAAKALDQRAAGDLGLS